MNVETKMKLMLVMDSYWDMLPPEIHEIILSLKRNQEFFDEEKKKIMKELGKEIMMYKELKEKWALGHIKCVVECYNCCYKACMRVYGCYVDEEDVKRERFLGYDLKSALQRINHVKWFMYFFYRINVSNECEEESEVDPCI